MRALAVAVVLVASCDSGGGAPGGPTTGGIQFVWTIGGQPAATGCAAGSTVSVQSTVGPVSVPAMMTACSDGHLIVPNLPAGTYVFKAIYVNPGAGASVPQNGINAMVVAGQVATADAIDFQTGSASLQVSWTINGGMHCPAGTMVTVEASQQGAPVGLQMAACSDYTSTLAQLPPANYTVDVILTSGGMQAMGEMTNVMVLNGANMVGPIDVSCTFCP